MSAWMLYSTLVALLVGAAAWTLERALHSRWVGLRWLWVGSIAASCVIPSMAWLQVAPAPSVNENEVLWPDVSPSLAEHTPTSPVQPFWLADILATARIRVTALTELPPRLDPWAMRMWAFLTLGVVGALGGSFVSLRRSRRKWASKHIDGRDIFVSEEMGPAIVGVVKPDIVLPSWALELPRQDRELVLRHEEEHQRAGDLQLLYASMVLLALLPWNAALWWQVRRLRMAVELDCDRRVLTKARELRRYASLLIEMGRRGTVTRLGALALAQPQSFLERRIRTMIGPRNPRTARKAVCAIVASLLTLAAYRVEAPALPRSVVEEAVSAIDDVIVAANPSSMDAPVTPFDVHTGSDTLSDMPVTDAASMSPEPAVDWVIDLVSGWVAPASRIVIPPAPTTPSQVIGRISGRAINALTREPIQEAQIYLVGANLGSLSRQNGAFVLLNVPAGPYTIRAERIGYTTISQDITVRDGAALEITFEMHSQATGLDEIVITGVPGRRVGEITPPSPTVAEELRRLREREAQAAGTAAGLPSTQALGRITGRVVDAATKAPLAEVQVYLAGANIGSLTRQNGQFVILNVPAGTYEMRAERIGLTGVSQQITIGSAEVIELTIELNPSQLSLDEIVVTGTAGAARRREIAAGATTSSQPPVRDPRVAAGGAADVRTDVSAQVAPQTAPSRTRPGYTPHTQRPELLNTEEVQRALIRSYPPMLRDAQIGGTTVVWIYIAESGIVDNALVQVASGKPELDQAALEVARVMRFTPALNVDRVVPVWVSIPITFRIR
jgi:TonB family protein